MAEGSKIQWTDHTFNPWIGCSKVAPGCTNCYAEEMMDTRFGKVQWGPKGTRSKTSVANWNEPLKWNKACEASWQCNHCGFVANNPGHCPNDSAVLRAMRSRVFCASLADVFEDWDGPMLNHQGRQIFAETDGEYGKSTDDPITMSDVRSELFKLIDATPHLDWLLVTKRPENIRRMWPIDSGGTPQPIFPGAPGRLGEPLPTYTQKRRENIWLLTSVSEQATVDRNVRLLMGCRYLAPVLGVSAEPLLGEIDFSHMLGNLLPSEHCKHNWPERGIDWVIAGGESGTNARPCHEDWIRSIIKQCKISGVPCFVKQMGTWWTLQGHGKNKRHDRKGGMPSCWARDLDVREFPREATCA